MALIEKKKSRLKKGAAQKRSRGKKHWKVRVANKKKALRKMYERTAGLGPILQSYGAKRIDQELWDRYIGECFREYTPKWLTVVRIKRPPGLGQDAYYGSKQWPFTVYSYRVHHEKLGVVWDGEEQRQLDGAPILRISQA